MEAIHEHRPYNPLFPISITKSYNLTFIPHWHREVELVYVQSGSLKMGINQQVCTLHQGGIAISGSRNIHYFENLQKDTVATLIIFHPEMVGSPGGWPENIQLQKPFLSKASTLDGTFPPHVYTRLEHCIRDIVNEQDELREGYPLIIKSRLFEICGLLTRYLSSPAVSAGEEQKRLLALKRMQQVLEYIDANHMNHLDLEEAAGQANLSPFHFSRLFKSTMGIPFKSYVNRIRINKAENLLQNSQMSITDIAFECGFESIRTFNRVFKSIKGSSPSAFR